MTKRIVAACPILLFFVLLWVRQTPLVGAPAAPFTEVIVQGNQGAWGNNLGDLDGDGYLDIIEGGGDLGGSVYWYLYPTWQRFQIGNDGGGDDLQVADINRDGKLDVVVNGTGKIVWYENPRGTGGNVQGLWTKHTVDSTRQSHDIVVTDLNRDGKLDILIRIEEGATYYYLQGATADTWTRIQIPQAPNGHGGLEVGDINRDGRPDIVENGFWLEGPADPATGVWIKHDIVSWTQGSSAAIFDINKDGRLDIFLAVSESGPGSIAWFEAPVDPINGTWVRHNIDTLEDVHRFFLIDVNKDGTEDLVFAEMHQAPGKRVGVYYNNGLGASWTLNTLSTQGSHNIAVGDIGNDGDIDIIGANWSTSAPDGGAQKIWRNDLNNALPINNWTYIQADNTRQQNLTFGLTAGDIDEDGWPDILSGEYWYKNPKADLTGAWARTSIGPYDGLFIIDVDDDGTVDVLAQRSVNDTTVGFYRLTPNANFTSWTPLLVGTTPPTHPADSHWTSHAFRLAQIVPGGKPEIVLTAEFSIYYFQIPANPALPNWPRVEITNGSWGHGDAQMVDFDRDGDLDLTGFYAAQSLGWWENPGTGAGGWVRHDIGTLPNQQGGRVVVADFNGDGRTDVAVTEGNLDGVGNGIYMFECPANALSPNWTRRTVITNLGSLNSLEVGDFDQNGRPDLMTGTHRGNLQGLILKSADFGITWTSQIVNTGFESHIGMRPFDLDRDGDFDIISQAWDDFQFLHIWRNNAVGSGGADTTPPQITAVSASNVSAMSAQINWTTNEPADSKVDYGLTTQYGSSVTQPPLVSGHIVPLSGLTPSTLYHYRVTSKDASNNTTASADFTFTTSTPDTTPPVVSNITVNPLAATSATVNWTTNEPADGRVEYGTTTNYGSTTPLQPGLVLSHAISIAGLSASTEYHFRIHTRDSSLNPALPSGGTFTTPTPDLTPPTVSITAPAGGANVVGTINVTASAGDNVGVAGVQFLLDGVAFGAELTTAPFTRSWDSMLSSNGLHTWRAVARDAAGNSTTSDPVTVTVSNVILVAHRQTNGATNNASAGNIAVPFSSPALAGNLIVAAVSMGGATSMTCSDTQGNTYTTLPVQYDSVNDQALGVCYAPNIKAGATTVTATFPTNVTYYRRLIIHEYSGLAQVNPVDITVATIASGTTAANNISTTAGMTTSSNDLIFAAVMDDTGLTNIQAGTGFTLRASVGGSDLATEDRVQPGVGSIAGTFTFGNAHRYLARMVAFKTGAPPDSTLPDVSVTAPSGGTTVSGNVQLTATASDNVGVVGLQFRVGGVNVGAEITNGNFTFLWDSTTGGNGQRVITAVARDAAGNTRTSVDVTVNVNNIDVTPPGFQNVVATGITTTGATITWTTTEPATTQVQYGPTTNYGFLTTLDPTLAASHSQPIGGLTPGTTYFFRALSSDADGNAGMSNGSMFTTVTPDTTPPNILNLNVTGIGTTGATIGWSTNENATTQVRYGPDTTYAFSTTLNPALTAGHSQTLGGLSPATTYFYRVLSTDAAGNTGSAESSFTTAALDTTPPVLSAVNVTNLTSSSATINWTTNEGGTSQVTYGLSSTYGQSTTFDPALVTVHGQPLTNLQAGTLYHFQAVSIDAAGNPGVSGDFTFTTLAGEAAVPATGLVSRWKFNETSGTAAADSAGASPGTLTNFACTTLNCNATSGWTTPGRFVGAINLDGTNDVVNAGSAASLDNLASFTYSAWIFPRSLGEGNVGRIADKTATGAGFKRFRLNNSTANSFHAQVSHSTTNATAISAANTATPNEWQHVVMTYDGTTRTVRIYKNGTQIASGVGTGTPQSDAAGSLLIGNNPGGGATFNGLIDDVIVYNRALSPDEIQVLGGAAPDLTAPLISAVTASNVTATGATITWNTDELADSQVEYGPTTNFGSTTPVNPALVQAHSIALSALTPGTTYHVRVHSRDSSGNLATSDAITFTTTAPDTTPPSNVVVLTPSAGTVTGSVNVTASASDNVGVTSVQYFLDGIALSGEIAAAPYTFAWNTATATNGNHSLTAVAKDAAGLTATSPGVAVNVSNASTPVAFVQSTGSNNNAGATTIVQAFTSPVTAGSLIVVAVSWGNSSTLTCSDTQGNLYTTLPTQFDSSNDQALGICYAPNAQAGATTVTATFGSNASYRRILVHEYRGIATTNPVDVTTGTIANGTTAANAITTGSVTTTTAGALIFAAVMDDAGTTTIQAGTGFTLRASTSSDLASEDRVQPAIGPISGTFTFSTAHRYIARVVAFKPGG